MISDVEDYFSRGCGRCDRFATAACSTRRWAEGLAALRRICLTSGLTESAKWGHPCYMHANRNIVILGAFRDNFRLSFFNAGLMKDPENRLERQGPNTRFPDMFRFHTHDGPAEMAPTIAAYIEEAKFYADRKLVEPKDDTDLILPPELVDALAADPHLSNAFHALTRGRQKSYVISLNNAKKPETRIKRIGTFRDRILNGKGAQER